MTVVVGGPDSQGVGEALEAAGATVSRIEGHATKESLTDAGVVDAETLLLTDMNDATAITVAKDLNPNLRVVTYATDTLPEFARAQADLALDPALFTPEVVAEELA